MGCKLVLFPPPFQGHQAPMLHLASLLHSQGFSITIIHTRFNSPDPTHFPHFNFHFIHDGLPNQQLVYNVPDSLSILSIINKNCAQSFKDCLSDIINNEKVACLIEDPMWEFTGDIAKSFNLPRVVLRTGSMFSFLVYDSIPVLQQHGYFPLQEAKLDDPIPELLPLKVKDLPMENLHNLLISLVKRVKNSAAVICNTFEEIESFPLSKSHQTFGSIPVFPIGPLHKFSPDITGGSIWEQDRSSISWLNTQPPKSVLYVSFGSAVSMSEVEFEEIAWGLANSKQPFLWVIRKGLVKGLEGNELLPKGYLEEVNGRGHIVKWAPQLEVLGHPSVGGFLTHCGWNSTLETICEGVPMICFPFFADQPINARIVCDSWRIGLRLEKGMKREDIERVIRTLMVEKEAEDMRTRAVALKEKTMCCMMKDGFSYKSLEKLTNYLLSL